MEQYITTGEAVKIAKVQGQLLRKYAHQGKLRFIKTQTGRLRFLKKDVETMFGAPKAPSNPRKAFYIRSSNGDKTSLQTQLELLQETHDEAEYVVQDKSSGLKADRVGIKKLIKLAKNNEIDQICITAKDRLTRFGYYYLEELFTFCNVEIVVLDTEQEKSLHEELMEDFMSLIASFSGKFYRLRGWEQQKRLLGEASKAVQGKQDLNGQGKP